MNLIDSHTHLDDGKFDEDREAVIERALEANVTGMMAIGTGGGPPDLEAAVRLADKYAFIQATVGVHPHDAVKAESGTLDRVRELCDHPKVVALGEIGLDYYYDFSPREKQQAVFEEQLRIASDARLPVVIHTRDAWEDTIRILEEHWEQTGIGGIMHCFSGGPDEARLVVDMGFHVSFAGIVTFPKALAVQEAAKVVPSSRLLVETDCPYLAPVPKRGKRNEPAFTAHTAAKLAELRGETTETIAEITSANFRGLCLPAGNGSE
jgi:TatD DNase family protein